MKQRHPRPFARLGACATALLGLACGSPDTDLRHEKILGVTETEHWVMPELQRPVQVLRTESHVPHIYASNRHDVALVQGFVMARDRYFMMDLARRLGLGTISELLGADALDVDQESRGIGMTYVADQITEGLTPELASYVDAFAAGINIYIDRVQQEELPPPSELQLAKILLGAASPSELMTPFDRRSVAAMVAVVLYQTSYETGDVNRDSTALALDTLFEGAPFEALRRAGARVDLFERIEPIVPVVSAPGFGASEAKQGSSLVGPATRRTPQTVLDRLSRRLARIENRLGRNTDAGFGSNAWAVAASHSASGGSLLAGDGHLSLTVPSILYQLGLDTEVFGRGNTHQLGLIIAGFPVMPIGTNGKVAWSQTQLMGDVTDWYREEIQLDEEGLPKTSRFEGAWHALERVDETFVVADVPALDSVGRTDVWPRFTTFDGRWIADIEGRPAEADEALAKGESLVNLQGSLVVPGDTDGDGVITAVSFDYGAFDAGSILAASDALGHAENVADFRDAMHGLVAYSQNFAVADANGSIFYGSYQATPCRRYLQRDAGGGWADGADPTRLLDGTKYGGFEIPLIDGRVDESKGDSDPYRCVVPFEAMPNVTDPSTGFVATANNDPGGLSLDGSLTNDVHYIGGPWDTGFRAATIEGALAEVTAAGEADIEAMARIQGDVRSPLGGLFTERLIASIAYARALQSNSGSAADGRAAALYLANKDAMDAVELRLDTWLKRGHIARSGVDTFYQQPSDSDREDAVATMIFNAWLPRVIRKTFDDEKLPGVWQPSGSHGRVRALHRFLDGRGPNNPLSLASFDSTSQESIFFDILDTTEVESSHEIILLALSEALSFLAAEPGEEASGGFGSNDMNQWLWGLRHYAKFESLLADFLGDSSEFGALTEQFAISTNHLPLADGITSADPRSDLRWFPRDGDQFVVDAGNPGLSGERFDYGSGPVMRMVVELNDGVVRGQNIIPGGQSALTDSPYFADQAAIWLANDTIPMRFSVDDVVAGSTGRESYQPH